MDKEIFAAVLDMETTGLEANEDVPLELGISLITKHGETLAYKEWLLWEPTEDYAVGIRRGLENDFVRRMHDASGLWDALMHIPDLPSAVPYSRATVDEEAEEFLFENGCEPRKIPMMGNSIGSLDRPFALVHFPRLNEALSYRNIDISSVKELCRANNPVLFETLQSHWRNREADHRVLGDINASIEEYLQYRQHFMRVED